MKHNFLRRLSALALALVMAASLCVTPAWASETTDPPETPDPTTPDPAPVTSTTPTHQDLWLSTQMIILADHDSSSYKEYSLDIGGLSQGETVIVKADNGVTLNGNGREYTKQIDASDGESISVRVGTTSNLENRKIEVSRTYNGVAIGISKECYVYCGSAPFTYTPATETLENVTVGKTTTVRINPNAHQDLFTAENIKFESSASDYASVKKSSDGFTATIKGEKATSGKVTITMTLTGGFQKKWSIGVDPGQRPNPAESITLSATRHTMGANETTFQLNAIVTPKDTTDTVKWESSDETLATVDQNGLVTRVSFGTGTVKITATAGSQSESCIIKLESAPSRIEVTPTSLTLDVTGENALKTDKIKAIVSGTGSSNAAKVTWTSSNTKVATVDSDGIVTAVSAGSATIKAEADFGTVQKPNKLSATCAVTVINDKSTLVEKVTLSEHTHSIPEDGTFTLTATVSPYNASDKTIKWSSKNPNVATVDEKTGKVSAVKAGEAVIIATAVGEARDACTVTVTPKTEIINLSFNFDSNLPLGSNKYTYTFKGNDYITVNAVLNPTGAADPIRWTSENSSIAAVSSGTGTRATVTEKGPGKTKIKAVPMDPSGKDRVGVDPAEITVTVSGIIIKRSEGNSAVTSLSLAQSRRETIVAEAFGSANNGSNSVDWTSSDPAIVSVSTKSGESTAITARKPGTAVITARKGTYTATCTVTVMEDTAGVINASTPAATAYQFSKLASQLQAACRNKTGKELSYITNLAVSSTDQGILHDQHHSSEDTGAGVGIQDRYYPGTAPQGQRSLNDLSFVPKNTFSGTAEISYTGWTTDNQSFSGVIRISVNGTGDVTYSSNDGSAVTFSAEDFNFYHPNLKSVSFTPPQDSVGTLYYNYTSASQPGTKVTAGATYNRTSNPSIDRVSFVPAAGYEGTVKIAYKGTDTGGKSFTGTVTITVTKGDGSGGNPADISYSVKEDSWLTLRPSDFNTASLRTLGESLSYVRFTPPLSSDGTLFYNYRGFSDFDSMVNNTTSYYYSGSPSLSGVSFVPITTTPGQVDINYTGYTTRGNTFEGTIHISLNDLPQEQQLLHYTVFTGKTVNLNAGDFNTACAAATGSNLASVQFTSLPGVSQGTLRYTRGNSSTSYNVTTGTRFFRTGTGSTANLIGNVYFQAASNYTGTVTIPFTGTGENGKTFTDEVVITVTPPQASDVTYSGTTASPIRLYASQIQSANRDVLSNVSYITFTSLPSSTAGKLYTGYNGFGTGTQVSTGTRYYVSSYPSIDQISFVPRGRYTGQASVGYTAYSTSGESVSGRIVFSISSTGGSSYFYDMGYHAWAAPSVDYLYQNGVTNGVTATSFGPNQQILRGDFVLMLCRAFNFNGANGYSFADVPTNSYFSQAVATAKQMGIVNGDGGNFRPYSPITRQDAMVIIKNALDAAGWNVGNASSSVLNRFSDGASVSNYAVNAVSTLVQLGAVNGDNGRLLPHNSITRAEAAVILHFVMTM